MLVVLEQYAGEAHAIVERMAPTNEVKEIDLINVSPTPRIPDFTNLTTVDVQFRFCACSLSTIIISLAIPRGKRKYPSAASHAY